MQRWSVGQRRRKHGLQYGFSCTILKRVVTGAVPKGSVGPKTATTGRPTAAATCMAPESFPTKTWHWDNSPGKDRKSTRLNSSHMSISYAVFCLKKKKKTTQQ